MKGSPEERVKNWKKKVDDATAEKNRLDGSRDTILKQLKQGLGVSSKEEAQKLLAATIEKKKKADETIALRLQVIESKYEVD